jgi:dTDP-4-amino-4,6-dideoxygalactose transaminase
MQVPFLDLKAQHKALGGQIGEAVRDVMNSSAFAGGAFVETFEREFASFCHCRHAVGVGSGTEALWLVLLGMGIGRGDEVITVPNTFIATAEAIVFCGATPVFVDVDEDTYTMSPAALERAITPRTKAIIPVHLFGQMADMDPLLEVAQAHGLRVIEDAAQAHGAEYKGARAGGIGCAGCFSFYPSKNLGACGEAGAVVTDDGELAQRIRLLRDHGQATKYVHSVVGWNARMDGLQAAILSVKLKGLAAANEARRAHARAYGEALEDLCDVQLPYERGDGKHVYHLYALRVKDRDAILNALARRGVGCGIHYPVPLHLQEAFSDLGLEKGRFPVAERCAGEFLSLPMFPELTGAQIDYVAESLHGVLEGAPAGALAMA